jgi:hypothetical protein
MLEIEIDKKIIEARSCHEGVKDLVNSYFEKLGYSYSHNTIGFNKVAEMDRNIIKNIVSIASLSIKLEIREKKQIYGDGTGGIDSIYHCEVCELSPQPLVDLIISSSLFVAKYCERLKPGENSYYLGGKRDISLKEDFFRNMIKNIVTVLYFKENNLDEKKLSEWTEDWVSG